MNNCQSKPRIALFAMGVIGGELKGHGVPVLEDLFARLSQHFEIVLYSFNRIDPAKLPAAISARQIISWKIPGRVKFLLLALRFAWDHVRTPYQMIFSVSVYPPGLWAVRMGKIFHLKVLVQVIALELVALEDIGYGNLTKPFLKKITDYVCKHAHTIIAVADYQRDLALKNYNDTLHIVSLPLRINADKFLYIKKRISLPVQFIHVAYYSPIKDQQTMFKAFSIVARSLSCHLTVIGEGYDVPEVHKLLIDLNISENVSFAGLVKQSEIPGYMKQAHIMLHPARFETGCAVIQEAMASGVAVCGTSVGILADIGEQFAVIVPPAEHEKLASEVLNLINNSQKFEQITTDANSWIRQFDAPWAADNYRQFILKVLQE